MDLPVYSFLDFHASLIGPGGAIPLGSGSGSAEEGITIEPLEETDFMKIGADGSAMHSLNANKASKVTIRLLKTSPTNALLMQMYSFQRASALNHGKNILVMTHLTSGDVYTHQQVAFAKQPPNTYGKEAGAIEWEFNVGITDATLGSGVSA